MARRIDLSEQIAKHLQTYTQDVTKGLEKAQKKVANDGVKTLKTTSPKDTGKYASGWAVKKVTNAGFVIYNKKRPQLTHLLEHGHAKVKGGRVSAKVHIKPVEDKVIDDYEKEVIRVIENG